MSDVVYFLILFSLYLVTIALPSLGGFYVSLYIAWIKYTENCLEIFNKSPKINVLPLVLKSHQNKSLIIFIFWELISVGYLIAFWWLLEGISQYFFIPFALAYLLSRILSYFFLKKLWKKMAKFKIYNQKEAVDNFNEYQLAFTNKLEKESIKFTLLKGNQKAARDQPFQFNQWRYKKKIKRLKKKNYQSEKYNFKLLEIYIKYLKTYSYFFKSMKQESSDIYVVEINQKEETIEFLKEVLIINFFIYSKSL